MQKVLITGGSGLLALNWACCVRDVCEPVLALHERKAALPCVAAIPVDLESAHALEKQLAAIKPNLVIHAAGYTDVDGCERHPAAATHANADLARNIARATAALGIGLVHISTDQLFDGTKSFVAEDEPPTPLNAYARSKLQAEHWVARENPAALIVRTNFFGWGHRYRRSLSDWIINSLRAGETITMFDNVFITPILADTLARAVHALAERSVRGIIHLAGDERISKYDFGIRLALAFGLPVGLIQRGKLLSGSLVAQRPLDMSLSNAQACKRMGCVMGSLNEFFLELRHQEAAGRRDALLTAVRE